MSQDLSMNKMYVTLTLTVQDKDELLDATGMTHYTKVRIHLDVFTHAS